MKRRTNTIIDHVAPKSAAKAIVKPNPAVRSTGWQLGDPHPKSKALNDWDGYTDLGDRLSNELDGELLKLGRAFWRKHRTRINRRDFKTLVFDAMEFRRRFPLTDGGKDWNP